VRHIFPPGSEALVRIDIGEEIHDTKTTAQCEEYFSQLQQKAAEERKHGD
jgi:hypothetical protein